MVGRAVCKRGGGHVMLCHCQSSKIWTATRTNSFPGVRLKNLGILQREIQWICVRERRVLSTLCDNRLDILAEIISPKNKRSHFNLVCGLCADTNWFPGSGEEEREAGRSPNKQRSNGIHLKIFPRYK